MCPDQQLFSIHVDNEMPSPWKEKLENHLTECPVCREKYESFRQLRDLFGKDTEQLSEQRLIETAKSRVWQKLTAKRRRPNAGLWHRRISIPLPAAAAAAIILTFMAGMWIRGSQLQVNDNSAMASQQIVPFDLSGFSLASEDGLPVIMPDTDLSAILQYLASDGADTIILTLPDSRNFSRTGEPGIIRAADYPGR
ncbi:MAG: zf-HC2 domain-containing protein [Treponema sp.]|nr:zf-HC2 domain-containing protein [Treponema sp.]